MHGVHAHRIFASLKNALLRQVCFGENELILHFEPRISVTIMGEVGIVANLFMPTDPRQISSFVVSLLGTRTVNMIPFDERTLEISFEDGKMLRIYDDSDFYESVIITTAVETLVI